MKTWKECQSFADRRQFLYACEIQRSWFALGALLFILFIAALISSCGYVGESAEYKVDSTNYERPYIFNWNHHSYLRFGWIESQTAVHNPDCICVVKRDSTIYSYLKRK